MHPLSFVCTLVFLAFGVPFVLAALDRKRPARERILVALFGSLLWGLFLGARGFSPIRGAVEAQRVNDLCSQFSVGRRFDADRFEEQARARGLRAIVSAKRQDAYADAPIILRVVRVCEIEYANGRIVKIRNATYAP